jgi:hypothetical protein
VNHFLLNWVLFAYNFFVLSQSIMSFSLHRYLSFLATIPVSWLHFFLLTQHHVISLSITILTLHNIWFVVPSVRTTLRNSTNYIYVIFYLFLVPANGSVLICFDPVLFFCMFDRLFKH